MGSHKKTTSQSILELVNPVPVPFDPEDDINTATVAKVVENYREDFNDDDTVISKFKSIDLLEAHDARYSGRKVSRKSLDTEEQKTKTFNSRPSGSDNHSSDEDWSESFKSGDTGDSEEDAVGSDSVDDGATDDDAVDTGSTDRDEDIAAGDSFDITSDTDITENKHVSEIGSDNFQHVANRSANLEIEKGRCVRNQLRVWDSLLECRIHLQKCLLTANRLPCHSMFEDYKLRGEIEFKEMLNSTQNFVTDLLEKFIMLREALLKSFPETKNMYTLNESSHAGSESADEEIPSDTEDDTDDVEEDDVEDKSVYEPKIKKRKIDEYATLLATQHKGYQEYRNNTIQKWNDKTRVSSGKISSRNFSNFEQSTLKQIEQILNNRHRLIQRTQLKRSTYSSIGQQTSENAINEETDKLERLKEYNPEIFDDSDFYHQLLRELIERKTADVTDPVQLGRQWLELQKLRSKMKRKIDIRATKGRRIKYVVHPKLVNFMAPVDESSWTNEAKTELYNSLFGKKKL